MNRSTASYNLIRLIWVAVVLFLLIWPAYFTRKIYAYFPFFAVLILVTASVLLTLYIKRNIRFDSEDADIECDRGSSVPMSLKVYNDGFLMSPKAVAYLYVSDLLGGADTVTPAVFTMAARGMSDFSFDVRMDHIGQFSAGIREMEIYDFLGLFRFPLGISQELTVSVLPRRREDPEIALSEQSSSDSMRQNNAVVSDGFDYAGVREYELGDSMKRIHWKLSARSPHYMTKLTETSMRNDLAIIMDPVAPVTDMETFACLYDALVEYSLSYVHTASTMETDYAVFFYGRDETVQSMIPRNKQDDQELVRRLAVISPRRENDEADAPAIIRREQMVSGGSSNLIVVSTSIYDDLINALIDVKNQGRYVSFLYILPGDFDNRQQEEAEIPLNALSDYDINCRTILADPPEE